MVSKKKKKFQFEVYEDTGNDTLKHFSVKLHWWINLLLKEEQLQKRKLKKLLQKEPIMLNKDEI